MDDDWEALAEKDNVVIAPKIQNINKWEGEDEDDDVKESWEDEEEKKDEEKVKEEIKPAKTKPKKVLQTKVIEKEQDIENKLEKESADDLSVEEKLAEKLRLQKIQQEEDLKTAMDTFGITEQPSGIDGMHPTNKAEFAEFAQAISNKVSVYKSAEEFPGFVEDLLRSICANLQAAELKKVKMTMDNLYLEKQKIEKEKAKKPGKGKTKVKLRVEEDNVKANNIGDYGYDYDYDDFM